MNPDEDATLLAQDIGRAATPSSRSSSPSSDDIDEEPQVTPAVDEAGSAALPQPPAVSVPTSKSGASGHKSGRTRGNTGGRGGSAAAAATKRRGTGKGKDDGGFRRNASGYEDYEEGNGLVGGLREGAYEKLLDLDYARDFGDPFAHFDALRNAPAAAPSTSASSAAVRAPPASAATDAIPPVQAPILSAGAPAIQSNAGSKSEPCTGTEENKMETDA